MKNIYWIKNSIAHFQVVTPSELMGNIYLNETVKTLGVCSPAINPSISVAQGFLVEFAISFILALVCCGVWDAKNSDKHDSVPIRFGLTIAVLALAAVSFLAYNTIKKFITKQND